MPDLFCCSFYVSLEYAFFDVIHLGCKDRMFAVLRPGLCNRLKLNVCGISSLFSIIFSYCLTLAQGEIDEQKGIFFRDERTFAAFLTSTGIGGNFRYAKRITAFKKTLYEIDLVNIKHPKEVKISTSTSTLAGRSFVYGKLNHFFNLRAGLGFQKEIFQKFDRGGISIRYFYNFGPALGIKKPVYYYIYEISADGQITGQKIEKFDITQHVDPRLMSKASFFNGIN